MDPVEPYIRELQQIRASGTGVDESSCCVHLNGVAHWRNVPVRAWGYVIGGYQVMKRWLSYRERDVLGRSLTADEAREVTDMARRMAAFVLLQPALDANYRAVKGATCAGRGAWC